MNDLRLLLTGEDRGYRSISDKTLQENLNVLREDMFDSKKVTADTKKLDQYCQELVDLFDEETGTTKVKPEVNKILGKITGHVNKMFNLDLDLVMEYNRYANVAYTIIKNEAIDKARSNIKKLIVDKKNGYHMVKLTGAQIFLEDIAFTKLIFPTKGRKNISIEDVPEAAREFTGRHLAEIILHEIGHNIFAGFYIYQDNEGILEFKAEGQTPVVVNMDESKYNSTLLDIVTLVAATSFLVTTSFLGGFNGIILGIIGYLGITGNRSNNKKFKDFYMRNEKNANTLPLQYGYGKEILDSTIMIDWLSGRDANIFSKMRIAVEKLLKRDKYNYQSLITTDLLKIMDMEYKNPNNSKKQKEQIKSVKEYYVNEISKMQTERGITSNVDPDTVVVDED